MPSSTQPAAMFEIEVETADNDRNILHHSNTEVGGFGCSCLCCDIQYQGEEKNITEDIQTSNHNETGEVSSKMIGAHGPPYIEDSSDTDIARKCNEILDGCKCRINSGFLSTHLLLELSKVITN
jgi:hypothetical protein